MTIRVDNNIRQDVSMSITEKISKIYKLKSYNEVINNLVYSRH